LFKIPVSYAQEKCVTHVSNTLISQDKHISNKRKSNITNPTFLFNTKVMTEKLTKRGENKENKIKIRKSRAQNKKFQ
jgi:hypothetical protein